MFIFVWKKKKSHSRGSTSTRSVEGDSLNLEDAVMKRYHVIILSGLCMHCHSCHVSAAALLSVDTVLQKVEKKHRSFLAQQLFMLMNMNSLLTITTKNCGRV